MKRKKFIQSAIRYYQGIVGLNKNDIILASFPRSGNTWTRFFFCNLLSICEWNGIEVDFDILRKVMPELGVNNLIEPWPYTTFPRLVKTHMKFSPIFKGKQSILVVRDPRDTMVSYYHFAQKSRKWQFSGTFSSFIRHNQLGLKPWLEHFQSWQPKSMIIIHFEDMIDDDIKQFKKILDVLDLNIPYSCIEMAAHKSRFNSISNIENKRGLANSDNFLDGFQHARLGKKGIWHDYFSQEDIAYLHKLNIMAYLDYSNE